MNPSNWSAHVWAAIAGLILCLVGVVDLELGHVLDKSAALNLIYAGVAAIGGAGIYVAGVKTPDPAAPPKIVWTPSPTPPTQPPVP